MLLANKQMVLPNSRFQHDKHALINVAKINGLYCNDCGSDLKSLKSSSMGFDVLLAVIVRPYFVKSFSHDSLVWQFLASLMMLSHFFMFNPAFILYLANIESFAQYK